MNKTVRRIMIICVINTAQNRWTEANEWLDVGNFAGALYSGVRALNELENIRTNLTDWLASEGDDRREIGYCILIARTNRIIKIVKRRLKKWKKRAGSI